MTASRNHTLGLAALATAGVLDLFTLIGLATEGPTGVILVVASLGLITLVGVAVASRGSWAGLLVAVVARVIDTALGVPPWFLDAPAWVLALVTATLVLTIAGIWLVTPAVRRTKPEAA
jgi:hypothetical protein